jgi:hypothetical protein
MSGEQDGKREGACGPAGAGAAGGCCASRATRPVGIRAAATRAGLVGGLELSGGAIALLRTCSAVRGELETTSEVEAELLR